MHDLFGDELAKWHAAESRIRRVFSDFGYGEIRTPALERLEVFKAVGEDTDIVQKQMFLVSNPEIEEIVSQVEKLVVLLDPPKNASLPQMLQWYEKTGTLPSRVKESERYVLRPEGTAAFMRSVIQHQLHRQPHAQRYYYYLPMYRYERPQKGRLRQFHQFGAELINDPSPESDAEVIVLLDHLYRSFEITEYEVRVNSVGCPNCRPAYRKALQDFFRPRLQSLCPQCQERFERAPQRVLDCKNEECQKLADGAPIGLDYLCAECKTHHSGLKHALSLAGVAFHEDPRIVRGLDYYSRTAFEFVSTLLGAQSALVGGGRYDGLSERFGEKPIPAVGFALGMERLILALDAKGTLAVDKPRPSYYFAPLGNAAFEKLFPMSLELRRRGVWVEIGYERGKGLKALLKAADRASALYAVIVGDDEIGRSVAVLRNMQKSTQEELPLEALDDQLFRRIHRAV